MSLVEVAMLLRQQSADAPTTASGWILTFGVFTPTVGAIYYFLGRSDKREAESDSTHRDVLALRDGTIEKQRQQISDLFAQVAALSAQVATLETIVERST